MLARIKNEFAAFVRDEEGASMVEYVLLVALIALVAYVDFQALGTGVKDKAQGTADDLAKIK